MTKENKDNPESKPKHVKETYLIIGAFVLMKEAIFTIRQVLLKGKMNEELSQHKDTIVQVKVDTLKIKDSVKYKTTRNTHTETKADINKETQQDISKHQPKLKNLTEEDKCKLKEKLEGLSKNKLGKIKKKLRSNLNR